jgi:bifunctional non-homologous end joining protein LigD
VLRPYNRPVALTEYKRKRRFDATPEPPGDTTFRHGSTFVVQEHHARRLHYDFRLEVNGVMKSWAVPKGPSMNPGDKRLAIQTEDHPLEYAKFQGEIPSGNYGAGEVIIWDNGTFEAEGNLSAQDQLDRGELKFILHGKKLIGSFVLVKIRSRQPGKQEWLMIKHRDSSSRDAWNINEHAGSVLPETTGPKRKWISNRPASSQKGKVQLKKAELKFPESARRAAMPDWIQPALASLSDRPFSDPDWLFEIKWDGGRTLARVQNGQVQLWSRSRRDVTGEYPELAGLPAHTDGHDAWLDGEIVALDDDGRSDFERLQQRFSVINPGAELMHQVPVVYYVFDILYCDGYDLRPSPLLERKTFLKQILRTDEIIRYSDHEIEKGKELYELALDKQLEGILGKQIHSPYPEGRTTAWLKFKLVRELDAVVGGWTEPRGTRQHFGALLLGLYDGKKLEFICGAGSGFSGEFQKRLASRLSALQTEKCPFATKPVTREKAYWVKPSLVARVKYGGWTQGRHLRQPTFLGLQEDHNPADCTFEKETKSVKASVAKNQNEPPVTRDSGVEEMPTPKAKNTTPVPAKPSALKTDTAISNELDRGSQSEAFVEIDGVSLRLTNLNKVYFPSDGYTKRNLLAYYYHIAPLLLPFLKDRPLVLRRYPNGIDGQAFFQKDSGKDAPEWIKTVAIESESKSKPIRYFVANDRASLLYLTNLGCIDHNPWSARTDDLEHPDYIFFDLDPTDGTPFADVAKLGKLLASKLQEIGMKVFLKTSGATGLHIFIPLERVYTYEQVRQFVQTIASLTSQDYPKLITSDRTVRKRPKGSIYIDAHQNSSGQSLASVYSVRAFPRAPISTPITADELTAKISPETWNISSIRSRIDKVGDLWADFWKHRQRLEPAVKRLERNLKRG